MSLSSPWPNLTSCSITFPIGKRPTYRPLGLVQFQTFLPAGSAAEGIGELLRISQQHHLPTYLGVIKRHRPDDFLLSHALDGYSMAMDFRVTRRNRERVAALLLALERAALSYDGRFYFAKDSGLTAETARAFLGEETLAAFRSLKHRCDPEGLLATNLLRRVFPELSGRQGQGSVAPETVAARSVG